jgi:hypothetical protein
MSVGVTAQSPSTVAAAGNTPLSLTGQARRALLVGTVDLYEVALYQDASSELLSPRTAKAMRIEVTAPDDLPHRIALEWRTELVPRLNPTATTHLRNAFSALRHGDVVLIEYTPSTGTVVRVNKTVAVPAADHDLMLAFLDHWIGQRPVSEELKRELVARVR